jgi:rfaE bifunctional protein nucleotidyltransferase chain/domain
MKIKSSLPWSQHCRKKWVEPHNIQALAEKLKQEKKSIVTLNGSFDLLHAGHLYIIFEAAKLADVLILALNSDTSIKQYKGPNRPIISLPLRLELLSAIECIDYLTWFDQPDPRDLLDKIRPHVHANGAEYGENCIESEIVKKHGGTLCLIPRIEGLATSEIIKKVHTLCD